MTSLCHSVQSVSSTADKSTVADSLLSAPDVINIESRLSPPVSPADKVADSTVTESSGGVVLSAHCPEIKRYPFLLK